MPHSSRDGEVTVNEEMNTWIWSALGCFNAGSFIVTQVMFFVYYSSATVKYQAEYIVQYLSAFWATGTWSYEDPDNNQRVMWIMLTPALAIMALGMGFLIIGLCQNRQAMRSATFWIHMCTMPCIFLMEVVLYFMVIRNYVYVNRADKLAYIIDSFTERTNISDYTHTPFILSTAESVCALIVGAVLLGVYIWGLSKLRGWVLIMSMAVVSLILVYQVLFSQWARLWTVTITGGQGIDWI